MTSDGQFKKANFGVGLYKNNTAYSEEGYYLDGDKVRFKDGKAEVLGGWVRETTDRNAQGVPREGHIWNSLDGRTYTAVGTHLKLEILDGGQWYDITPIVASISVSNSYSTSIGSSLVKISYIAHDRLVGDLIIVTTVATTIGGNIVIGGEYSVTSVSSNNGFYITTSVSAAATTTSVGGTGTIDFLLPVGGENNSLAFGWGVGTWGTPGSSVSAGWGDPRGAGVEVPLRLWSMDNWGEDLIACPNGGRIYWWDRTNGPTTRAVLISASPSVNGFIKVAYPTRHLVSYGATNLAGVADPLNVRWTDREDFNAWTVSVCSDAGEYRLRGGNYCVGVSDSKKEIMVFTDNTLFSQRYIGSDFIFGFDEIGSNIDLCGQNAAIGVNGVVYAMTTKGFFKYDGISEPMDSTVHDYVFQQGSEGLLNYTQKEKVYAGSNTEQGEIIWFYPAGSSLENNRYVIYNYRDNAWYDGTIVRTVWLDSGLKQKPYAFKDDGTLYVHEQGYNDDANPMKKYVESAYFDVGDGDDLMFIDKVVPDFLPASVGLNMNFTITTKKYPNDQEEFVKGPYNITNSTKKISLRARGRQAKIRYSTSVTNGYFKVGDVRMNVTTDGQR
jgi:hypothetical protein